MLVFTFNAMNFNDVDGLGNGEDYLFAEGFDVISVKSRSNLWYNDVSLEDVAAILAPLRYDEIVTYGTSMGGYAAAYFAEAIRPTRAILFSPQCSVDPRLSDWDERWKAHWSLPFRHAPISKAPDADTRYIIFYDPWTLDARHADAIAAGVGEANVLRVRVPFSGHETIGLVLDAGVLSKLVSALLRDSPEAPAHLATLRRGRKQTWSHAFHLFWKAQSQGRRIANRDLALEILRRAERPEHRILSLGPLLIVSAWVDAARLMQELDDITLGASPAIDGAVESVDAGLRPIEDVPVRLWLLPLWSRKTGRENAFGLETAPAPPPLFRAPETGLLPLVDEGSANRVSALAGRLGGLFKRRPPGR